MANQNQIPTGNSGSLEDCHTNVFALTDFAGIQYKKLVPSKDSYVNSLDDPILTLYTKCLQSEIICSWNKVKKDDRSNMSDMTCYSKEIWIFWFDGNDPFTLKNIIIPNSLREDDKGNWKNGITYEIRTIFFKALNTKLERYFISKGFVKMGPWLMMPFKLYKQSDSTYGFRFNYFLHGESTICSATDVRKVAVVRQITMKDLTSDQNQKTEVVLSPYAITGFLTGRWFKDDDPCVKQWYDEWIKYYPHLYFQNSKFTSSSRKLVNSQETQNQLPKFVEVSVNNFKMNYPSCLVCVLVNSESEQSNSVNVNNSKSKLPSRKRRIHQIDLSNGNVFSFVARRSCDRIIKDTMIPIVKRENIEKCSKSITIKQPRFIYPQSHAQCCCRRSSSSDIINKGQSTHLELNPPDNNCNSSNSVKTFHQRLKNFEIPYTKTLLPFDTIHLDFSSHKIPTSKIDSCCDRSTSPLFGNVQVNDPIMPTLSPQMPSMSESFSQSSANHLINSSNMNNGGNLLNNNNNTSKADASSDYLSSTFPTDINNQKSKILSNNFSQNIAIPVSNNTISVGNSTTPPMPSITPNSALPQNHQVMKVDLFHNENASIKLESSDFNSDKKCFESSPFGIEVNNKPLLSTPQILPNVSIMSKLFLNRKSVNCHSTEISDISLFPPIANSFQASNLDPISSISENVQISDVNYGLMHERVYRNAIVENSWLSLKSVDNPIFDGIPVTKKLKMILNQNRSNSFNLTNPEFPSLNPDTSQMKPSNNGDKVHCNFASLTDEQISVVPDQIFDSDEEEIHLKSELCIKDESIQSNYNRSSINEKLLSPNNSQLKIVRSSNTYGKFTGSSLLSSTGAGCVSGVELSLMYPTPPSLEGAHTNAGSPSEKQSSQQSSTALPHSYNEYNYPESILNSLSLTCQNWDEMEKDWSVPSINMSLFATGIKYSKKPNSFSKDISSFNFKRFQQQRNKIVKLTLEKERKFIPHLTVNNSVQLHRPNNLITHNYSQMSFANPNCYGIPSSKHSQRFPMNSNGQSSAPMTPASGCTNPPSVESSSLGTPRNMDHLNPPSAGFNRPQAVQSSPITARSPRNFMLNQPQMNVLNSISVNVNQSNASSFNNVNGLYFNVLLSDSILNIYKDRNFDSCNICVCNMSVLGSDVGLYIEDYQQFAHPSTDRSLSHDDVNGICGSKGDCKCGFSAIMNRHYAVNNNLFYEDEVEVTGVRKSHQYTTQTATGKDRLDCVGKYAASQILSIYDDFGLSFILEYLRFDNTVMKKVHQENVIEFQDFNTAVYHALEHSAEFTESASSRLINEKEKQLISKIFYSKKDVPIPKNHNDQIRLLMTLRPLLQEAVSNTRLLESSYTVDGPLTWKSFHRLAGRGNVESCEPQPLPRFQVFSGKHSTKDANAPLSGIQSIGESNILSNSTHNHISSMFPQFSSSNGFINSSSYYNSSKKSNSLSHFSLEGNPLCLSDGYSDKEKECLTVAPYAIREWDKLNLEPLYRQKEIAYAVATPNDSGKVLQKALLTFFKELNAAFQGCRLGHHFSFKCEKMKDDIHSSFIEINTDQLNTSEKMSLQPINLQRYWVKELSQTMTASNAEEFINKVLCYEKQCEIQTTQTLNQFGVHKRNGVRSTLFPTCDSRNRDGTNFNQTIEMLLSPSNGCGSLSRSLNTKVWSSDKDVYLVVYVVNPFTHGQDISHPTFRFSMQRMNKLCDKIKENLHPTWKSRVTIHLLSLSKIFDATQFGSNTGVGDGDGSSIGGRDSSVTSISSCTSSFVSGSVKWSRPWFWKSTAFAIYNSVRRKVVRVAGLQSILNGRVSSSNLCSAAKCSMARGCSSDDECESAASLINANRCLTKCGPAGFNEKLSSDYLKKFLYDSQDSNLDCIYISIYSPCYILAPLKSLNYQMIHPPHLLSNNSNSMSSESWGYVGDKSNVLFVCYCLSVDQRWLLATCTDQLGTILRSTQINITVPQLHLRKKASPRRIGLGKLWEFIQEVIADTCQPWRLVIGRLGRAGHGELKSWNGLLSRHNLVRVNQRFREECCMCHVWNTVSIHGPAAGSGGTGAMGSMGRCDLCAVQAPTIVSGCFVSLECHSTLRIFSGSVKLEERASSNLQLCTPRDISTNHILVFPTSTSAGAVQNDQDLSGGGMMGNEINLEEILDLKFGNEGIEELGPIDMNDNFASGFEQYAGFNPILHRTNSTNQQDLGSIGAIDPSISVCGLSQNYQNPFANQEEGNILMQQPLAMGYYVSTTNPGPLPAWFWSACPPLGDTDNQLPSCFKAALHLQTSLITQEDGSSGLSGSPGSAPHPLDSHQTCDVLRFVLDSYNALSWLTFDPSINDRRSCLPIHILCLAQLYQADNLMM